MTCKTRKIDSENPISSLITAASDWTPEHIQNPSLATITARRSVYLGAASCYSRLNVHSQVGKPNINAQCLQARELYGCTSGDRYSLAKFSFSTRLQEISGLVDDFLERQNRFQMTGLALSSLGMTSQRSCSAAQRERCCRPLNVASENSVLPG